MTDHEKVDCSTWYYEAFKLRDVGYECLDNFMASSTPLFQPIKVGDLTLQHGVVLAPSTRNRVDDSGIPLPLVTEYYSQRGSTPGTLLISEATIVAGQAGGYSHIPGIWSSEQIAEWKKVVEAVHSKGSYIYLQLWAIGRPGIPEVLRAQGYDYVSASNVQHPDIVEPPRPLTITEIQEYVQLFATGAANAVHQAGFDGVEVHGANGYLVDQFLQDVTNKRTDSYGGSIENQARFGLEILNAIVQAVGAEKAAIRLSPWSMYNGMRMVDPKPTFSYFVSQIRERYPNLSYIHVVEPRVDERGTHTRDISKVPEEESNDFIREIWAPRPLISCGGYSPQDAIEISREKGDLIAYSRHFIANPDLPIRIQRNLPLNKYDRSTFYSDGDTSSKGYTDYPFSTST